MNEEEQQKNLEKELKKKIDSFVEVTKHRLGRAPSLEDVIDTIKHLSGEQQMPEDEQNNIISFVEKLKSDELEKGSENPAVPESNTEEPIQGPKILTSRIYYGLGEDKKPDKHNVLFYEKDGRYFDCDKKEWRDEKPAVLGSLNVRPIRYHDYDIMSAMVNGVMDDDDYQHLEKAGMISESSKKVYDLMRQTEKLSKDINDVNAGQFDIEDDDHDSVIYYHGDGSRSMGPPLYSDNVSETTPMDPWRQEEEKLEDEVLLERLKNKTTIANKKMLNIPQDDAPLPHSGSMNTAVQAPEMNTETLTTVIKDVLRGHFSGLHIKHNRPEEYIIEETKNVPEEMKYQVNSADDEKLKEKIEKILLEIFQQ